MAATDYFANLWNAILNQPPKVSPFDEAGSSGTPIYGGYVETYERDPRLASQQSRYRTASDLLANVSVIAASVRFYLNLVASPRITIKPARDMGRDAEPSDAAKKAADFAHALLDDMDVSLRRVVRRCGLYRYHGFGVYEWTAKRRPDGMIGIDCIEPRPQHTIEQWGRDASGRITAAWQRNPQDGKLLGIPRAKFIHLIDDLLTDSPEGMGWFRHCVDPGERLRALLRIESQGYERDMRGIPVGYAPIDELKRAVANGAMKKEDAEKALAEMRKLVTAQAKAADTGALMESVPYKGITADGNTISSTRKWSLELLTGEATGFEALGKAIERLEHDLAMVMGTEGILMGGGSTGGNRALSQDKSRNLYLSVNGTTADICEGIRNDGLAAFFDLNGLPRELLPTLEPEDVAFKDAADVAKALADMATAGAVLAPDDPAIDDVRDLLGVSHQPEHPEMLESFLHPPLPAPKDGGGDTSQGDGGASGRSKTPPG